jgi:carbon-monoxide dehydrogenase medium subunit
MIPVAFAYVRARNVREAVDLLREHGDGAKLLAGGQSLIPLMKLRFAAPSLVIDIGGVAGLAAVDATGGGVTIGALTTHAALASDARLRRHAPALADAAKELGDAQVRNRGTIGGSCAHNDPAADYPAVLLALDAAFAVAGGGSPRVVDAADLFLPMYETTLAPGEMITHVRIADAPHSAYVKVHHPASGYAVVGAAVALRIAGATIVDARVAVTGAGYGAFRAARVERALVDRDIGDVASLRDACAGATGEEELRGDAFASPAYRAALADVVVERAIRRAFVAR